MIILLSLFRMTISQIYRIEQSEQLYFQFNIPQGSLIIDLNNPFSSINLKGEPIACNSKLFDQNIKCQTCVNETCINTQYLPNNESQNITMTKTSIELEDVFNNKWQEQFIFGKGEENILGLGSQRGCKQDDQLEIESIPQNPFVSTQFSICFGNSQGFISRDFTNPESNSIKYTTQNGQYSINLNSISFGTLINTIVNVPTFIDSINPYIQLPFNILNDIQDNLKQVFGFELKDKYLYRDYDKNIINELPSLTFVIDQTVFIEIKPLQYLYLSQDKQLQLGLRGSNSQQIVLGLPLFSQKLITLDQQQRILNISNYDCENAFFNQNKSQNYSVPIFILIVIMILLTTIYFDRRSKMKIQKNIVGNTELARVQFEDDL